MLSGIKEWIAGKIVVYTINMTDMLISVYEAMVM